MSWLRSNRWKVARRSVQILVILLLLSPALGFGFFRGTLISGELFGLALNDPLAALDYTLAARNLSFGLVAGALVVLAFYFVVGGRVFCSWVCPVHLVSEAGGLFRGKSPAFGRKSPLTGRKQPLTRKYWVLGLVLLLSLVTARPVFEIVSPIGAASQNIALGPRLDAGIAGAGSNGTDTSAPVAAVPAGTGFLFNASLLLVLFIFLMEVFVARGWWCGSTCPVGALYALVGRSSPTRVKIDHEACNNCGDCLRVCMVSDVLTSPLKGNTESVTSGDCSNCMNCVDACTQDALKLGFSITGRK
jgi:ferredoxin-type protein NapH